MKRLLLCSVVLAGVLSAAALRAQAPLTERTELVADDLVMTSTATETRAICTGNVKMTGTNLEIVCDRLEVIAARDYDTNAALGELKGFKYLLATGNVRLRQGNREATCGRAEVLPLEDRLVLRENPVLIDRATDYVARAEEMILLRGEQRVQMKNPVLSGPAIPDLGPEAEKALSSPRSPDQAPPAPPAGN